MTDKVIAIFKISRVLSNIIGDVFNDAGNLFATVVVVVSYLYNRAIYYVDLDKCITRLIVQLLLTTCKGRAIQLMGVPSNFGMQYVNVPG